MTDINGVESDTNHPKLAAFTFVGAFLSLLLWTILVDLDINGWFALIPLLLGFVADIVAISQPDSLHTDNKNQSKKQK